MQLTIEIDDDLARQFLETTPKDEQKFVWQSFIEKYLQKKSAVKTEPTLDFVGMWAKKDMDVDEYMHELRKGRQFNVDRHRCSNLACS